jgi:hypothetical protein
MTDKEIDALGVSVSRQCEWDGDAIYRVLLDALTDANFHELRTRLEVAGEAYWNEPEEETT